MKNYLALDTSSPVLSVALKSGKNSVSESKVVGFLKHAENLMPMIDELLKKNNLTLDKVDAFLIGQGPGSFTGLRIGFATLKGLISGHKNSCFGALSLDMIAEAINLPEKSDLAVCLDARRDKYYIRFYKRRDGEWKAKKKIQILSLKEFADTLPKGCYVTGDALIRFEEQIKKAAKAVGGTVLPEDQWYPKAATLIRWAETKNSYLTQLRKPEDFLPSYFRLSEAEEKRRDLVPT